MLAAVMDVRLLLCLPGAWPTPAVPPVWPGGKAKLLVLPLSTLGKAKLMLDELPRLLVLLLSGGGSVTSVLMRLCLALSLMLLLPWLLKLAELSVLSLSSLLLPLPLLLIVEMSQQHHWAKLLQPVWQRANS